MLSRAVSINTVTFMTVVGIIGAVALTVLAYIFIIPEKKRAGLGKLMAFVHDILNFKSLFIEKILKALYALCTFACIAVGACWLFGFSYYSYGGEYGYTHTEWMGGWGILLMILGPIAVRIVYEVMMMFILLVKNTIEINNKIKSDKAEAPAEIEAPVETPVQE